MAYADLFKPDTQCSDDYVVTAGSNILYQFLPRGYTEGRVYTLSLAAAASALAETIDVYISGFNIPLPAGQTTPEITLQKGSILLFGASPSFTKPAVVAQDTVVNVTTSGTAVEVPVDPLTTALLGTDEAETWGLLALLAPTAVPINNTSQMVEGTNLRSGLQGTQNKVNIEFASQITLDMAVNDKGYWDYVHEAAQNTCKVFSVLKHTSGQMVWGPALLGNLQVNAPIKEQIRPQYDHMWQPPTANSKPRRYLTTARQAAYSAVHRLAGLGVAA